MKDVDELVKKLLAEISKIEGNINVTVNINKPIYVSTTDEELEDFEDYYDEDSEFAEDIEGLDEVVEEELNEIENDRNEYRQAWRILRTLIKIRIPDSETKDSVLNLFKQIEEVLGLK